MGRVKAMSKELVVDCLDLTSRLTSEMFESYTDDTTIALHCAALIALQNRGTPVTVGTIDGTIGALDRNVVESKTSILKALRNLRDTAGGYIEVDNDNKLQWTDDIGEDKGQQIRYKKNLTGMEKQTDFTKLVNRLYAYGSGSVKLSDVQAEDYVDDSDSQDMYGIYIGFETRSEINDGDALLAWANLRVAELAEPEISYRIKTADFSALDSYIDWSFEDLQLGSVVNVIDEELGAAATLDIGSAATDRATTVAATNTYIDLNNKADHTGKITNVEIWANTELTGCKVGTFRRAKRLYGDVDNDGDIDADDVTALTAHLVGTPPLLTGDDLEAANVYILGGSEGVNVADLVVVSQYVAGTIDSFDYTPNGEQWFYPNSGADFFCRDFATLGTVTAGSKQTFSALSIDCEEGDYIGIYFATGTLESVATGHEGVYSVAGDQTDGGDDTYALAAGDAISVYGTGTGLGIDINVRVVKIVHSDMNNPENMTIDVANKLPDITDYIYGIT